MSPSDKTMVVAVRVRPLNTKEIESGAKSCCQIINNSIISIKKEGNGGYLKSEQAIINEYAFDACFDESSTQVEVYEQTAKPFLPNLLKGLNVTVFCYGATGSGKTHTMLGNTRQDGATSSCEAGIIPNAVFDLFQLISVASSKKSFGEKWILNMTYIEVYNEQVYDLLDSSGRTLSLREDSEKGQVTIAGATEQSVNSYQEVIDFLIAGNKNRRTEATNANSVSSRSHAVLQLNLQHTTRTSSGRDAQVDSKLSLIDLAGSERASATNNTGVRLQEGANINKSLLSLANCINSLSNRANGGSNKNIKYRDSKLTHLLKSSLEGNCNLVMIANVNPSHLTYEDSHNTIKYANRSKSIKVNPTMKENTKELSGVEREQKLKQENEFLRQRVIELESIVKQLQRAPPVGFIAKSISELESEDNDPTISAEKGSKLTSSSKLSADKPARSGRGRKGISSEPASCASLSRTVLPPIKESGDISRFSLGSDFDPLGSIYANALSDSILEDGLFNMSEPPTPIVPVAEIEQKMITSVASRKGKRTRESQPSAKSVGTKTGKYEPNSNVSAATDHVSISGPVDNVFSSLLTEDINPLNVSIESMYPAAKKRRSQIPIAKKSGSSSKRSSSKSTTTAVNIPTSDIEQSENIAPCNQENDADVWEDPVTGEDADMLKSLPISEPVSLVNRSKVAGLVPARSRRQSLAQVSMMLDALSDPMGAEDGINTRARRVSVSAVSAAVTTSTSRRKSSVSRRLM